MAKGAVGEKLLVARAKNKGIEHPRFEQKSSNRNDGNGYNGSEEMPPQFFEVVNKRHIVLGVGGNRHNDG